MKKIVTFSVVLFLVLLCACGSTSDNEKGDGLNPSASPEESLTPVIYEDDSAINHFIVAYNELYPEDMITADEISKYYHHGQEHDDQITTKIAGFPVTISSEGSSRQFNVSVFWDNPTPGNADSNKRLFSIIEHVFNSELTDAQIDELWQDILDNSTHSISWDDGTEFDAGTNISDIPGNFEYAKMYG